MPFSFLHLRPVHCFPTAFSHSITPYRALFVEKAYSERAAEVLARETGIAIYTLDSLTSGDMDEEAYERGILADAQTLKEALENADA